MSKEILQNKEKFKELYEKYGSAELGRKLGIGIANVTYYARKYGLKYDKKKHHFRASKGLVSWFNLMKKKGDKMLKNPPEF